MKKILLSLLGIITFISIGFTATTKYYLDSNDTITDVPNSKFTGYIQLTTTDTPTAVINKGKVYYKGKKLYLQDEDGVETDLGTGGSGSSTLAVRDDGVLVTSPTASISFNNFVTITTTETNKAILMIDTPTLTTAIFSNWISSATFGDLVSTGSIRQGIYQVVTTSGIPSLTITQVRSDSATIENLYADNIRSTGTVYVWGRLDSSGGMYQGGYQNLTTSMTSTFIDNLGNHLATTTLNMNGNTISAENILMNGFIRGPGGGEVELRSGAKLYGSSPQIRFQDTNDLENEWYFIVNQDTDCFELIQTDTDTATIYTHFYFLRDKGFSLGDINRKISDDATNCEIDISTSINVSGSVVTNTLQASSINATGNITTTGDIVTGSYIKGDNEIVLQGGLDDDVTIEAREAGSIRLCLDSSSNLYLNYIKTRYIGDDAINSEIDVSTSIHSAGNVIADGAIYQYGYQCLTTTAPTGGSASGTLGVRDQGVLITSPTASISFLDFFTVTTTETNKAIVQIDTTNFTGNDIVMTDANTIYQDGYQVVTTSGVANLTVTSLASSSTTIYGLLTSSNQVVNNTITASTITSTGNLSVGGTASITGAITGATLDTGQGANELYDMDQNVLQASAVTFATVDTGQGANELYDMDQNVLQASDVTFASVRTDSSTIQNIYASNIRSTGTVYVWGRVDSSGAMYQGGYQVLTSSYSGSGTGASTMGVRDDGVLVTSPTASMSFNNYFTITTTETNKAILMIDTPTLTTDIFASSITFSSGAYITGQLTVGGGSTITFSGAEALIQGMTTLTIDGNLNCSDRLSQGGYQVLTDSMGIITSTSIDTSAELAAILTDEIGSIGGGKVVFSINPTLSSATITQLASSSCTIYGAFISSNSTCQNTLITSSLTITGAGTVINLVVSSMNVTGTANNINAVRISSSNIVQLWTSNIASTGTITTTSPLTVNALVTSSNSVITNTLTVSSITANGQIRASSMTVYGLFVSSNMTVNNTITASSMTLTGRIYASSANVVGTFYSSSATITNTMACATATVSGRKVTPEIWIGANYYIGGDTTTASTNPVMIFAPKPFAITISTLTVSVSSGTNCVCMIEQRLMTAESSAGTDVWSGDVTALQNIYTGGTVSDFTVPANYGLWLVPTSWSGTPKGVNIKGYAYKD